MAEKTKIQWTDSTFNPWRGCTKVSEGCRHCYAETLAHRNPRVLGIWGPQGTRPLASESLWEEPRKWNREAHKRQRRHRVFCASLADVFEDRRDLDVPRQRLFNLVEETPWLDWQILTKRPENVSDLAPLWCDDWPVNAWLLTSIEDQENANARIPWLLRAPARLRGLSVEPLLSEIDLGPWLCKDMIHWVIVGGESGSDRACDVHWVRSLIYQCRHYRVPVFVKQLGATPIMGRIPLPLLDRKGGTLSEWPADLQVREFPREV